MMYVPEHILGTSGLSRVGATRMSLCPRVATHMVGYAIMSVPMTLGHSASP